MCDDDLYNILRYTQNSKNMNRGKATKILCSSIKSSKNSKIYRTQGDVQVRLWLKNGCFKIKVYISELVNLSVETINAIFEDVIDLL